MQSNTAHYWHSAVAAAFAPLSAYGDRAGCAAHLAPRCWPCNGPLPACHAPMDHLVRASGCARTAASIAPPVIVAAAAAVLRHARALAGCGRRQQACTPREAPVCLSGGAAHPSSGCVTPSSPLPSLPPRSPPSWQPATNALICCIAYTFSRSVRHWNGASQSTCAARLVRSRSAVRAPPQSSGVLTTCAQRREAQPRCLAGARAPRSHAKLSANAAHGQASIRRGLPRCVAGLRDLRSCCGCGRSRRTTASCACALSGATRWE